jgi:hypothetical protein
MVGGNHDKTMHAAAAEVEPPSPIFLLSVVGAGVALSMFDDE